MSYIAREHFIDLQDNRHEYNPGDVFPRDGLKVSDARLMELSTKHNKRGRPVIDLVKDNAVYFKEEPAVVDDFADKMNPPEPAAYKEPIADKEPQKPKRGRKKKADA